MYPNETSDSPIDRSSTTDNDDDVYLVNLLTDRVSTGGLANRFYYY